MQPIIWLFLQVWVFLILTLEVENKSAKHDVCCRKPNLSYFFSVFQQQLEAQVNSKDSYVYRDNNNRCLNNFFVNCYRKLHQIAIEPFSIYLLVFNTIYSQQWSM